MKQKAEITVKIDENLLKKAETLSEAQGQSINNMIVGLIRDAVAYHERVHGKL